MLKNIFIFFLCICVSFETITYIPIHIIIKLCVRGNQLLQYINMYNSFRVSNFHHNSSLYRQMGTKIVKYMYF